MLKVTENVRLLGNGYFNYFLIGDRNAALVECGTRASALILSEQLEKMDPKPKVKYIIALHSHFDHSCGIPMLKQFFPQAQVAASAMSKKLLSKGKIVKDLFNNDELLLDTYLQNGFISHKPDTAAPAVIDIDLVLEDGDILELDQGLSLKIIDAPGHSICSIAAYLDKDEFMIASDAVGYRFKDGGFTPTFFNGFRDYMATIKKLMTYPTRALGPAHGDLILGDDVMPFYQQVLGESQRIYEYLREQLRQGVDETELNREVFANHIKEGLSYYPREMMKGAMHLLIKSSKAGL